jgi:UDP-glucuronate decarboxylase
VLELKDPIIKEDLSIIKGSIDAEAFQGKKVLVSGGSGFLGSWICDVLSEVGSRVICLDNLSTGVFENIEHLKGTKGFELERADVCTYSRRPRVDMVFHLASRPAPEDYQKHPVETALANATGTDKMLDLARKNDARAFYASSSEVYGDPDIFPTPESYEGKVDPLGPRSCYEEGKRFGEALCKAYHDQYGLDVRIGRLFNSYGPRLRAEGFYGRVVSRFILQSLKGEDLTVFGDGSQTRSFCYVTDTLSGLMSQMGNGERSDVLNLGSEDETKIIDIAKKINQISTGRSGLKYLPFPPGDHMRRQPDITKARKMLGWKPKVGLDQGLSRTAKWFSEKNRARPNMTP